MRFVVAIVLAGMLVAPASARAGNPEDVDASYLYDGGAVMLFWGPLLVGSALSVGLPPRDRPFGFSLTEGGEPKSDWEVPAWAVGGIGLGTVGGIVASGDASRYYHAKGLAESLATTMFLTGIMKTTFSRRRPYWTTKAEDDARRSFPSGHTSQAFAIAAYATSYLHDHVEMSDPARGAAYAGIGLLATGVAISRVRHKRHHASDVIVGALLGTVTSLAIYRYQQARYEEEVARQPSSTPTTLSMSFTW